MGACHKDNKREKKYEDQYKFISRQAYLNQIYYRKNKTLDK